MTLVMNTVVDKGPIIFLRLAEGNAGEIDGTISSFEDTYEVETNGEPNSFLNFTQIQNLKLENGDDMNLSPRKNYFIAHHEYGNVQVDSEGIPILDSSTIVLLSSEGQDGYLVFFKTEWEREMQIGRDYEGLEMGPNECWVPELMADLAGYQLGDKIWV